MRMKQEAAKEEAAIKIQAAQRGRNGRKVVANMKEERMKADAAATKIQAVQKGRLARKEVTALRREKNECLKDTKSQVNHVAPHTIR